MILVIGGTSDSYQLIEKLLSQEEKVMATVTTDYGQKLLREKFEIKIVKKRLGSSELYNLIKKEKIKAVVDATHPFAEEITKNAVRAAAEAEIEYLRFEREELDISDYQKPGQQIIKVKDYRQAAVKADQFNRIFLTTGSKNIKIFTEVISDYEERLFLRVMTFPAFIEKIIKQGIPPANIIAMKGPYTKEFNQALFKEYQAEVIVTKASGNRGGLQSKIEAAAALKLPIIIIERPEINYPLIFNKAQKLIEYIKSNL